MLRLKPDSILTTLILLLFSTLNVYAQISCINEFSSTEISDFNQLLYANPRVDKSFRRIDFKYRVAVKATVFHEGNGKSQKIATSDVKLLIQHANEYLNTIDVELYLQNEVVNHVDEIKYFNFLTSQEAELRAEFDVANAINVYLFHTISTEDDVFLNGSAALPNLSNNSNRIFLSYLDRNQEDFRTLKEKVFPHELGHYFGLLHTFQDSNNSDISKRELVSRDLGSGANCDKTGDFLCDTPSDPFERLVNISSFSCNDKLPDGLVDAFGATYSPPVDNIMSYHVRCGNEFTSGQYQRMQQAFSIRFSPNASYNLLGNQANHLIVNQLRKDSYCEGEEVVVNFSAVGDFARQNNFVLEMSDSKGENFSEINNAIFTSSNSVRFRLPSSLIPSSNYQVRIVSKLPYLVSTVSENFTVHTKGTLKLSLSQNIIRPNTTATLFLDFTGSGPWEVTFENGIVLAGITNRRHQIRLRPEVTNSYTISSAVGLCGSVPVENAVTLAIAEPTIKVGASFTGKSCESSFIQIPVSGLRQGVGTSSYLVKLSNADTTFNVVSNASSNAIFVLSPKFFTAKSNLYDLIIEGTSIEEYSRAVKVEVSPKPAIPESNKNVSFCFNTAATPLKATGTNIKWYTGQTDFTSTSQLIPRTTQTGVFYYYVSQTNSFGCESDRNEIKVQIREPAFAAISGNKTIKFGDRTALAVRISGDAPWNFELSDGQVFTTPEPEIFPEVQPSATQVYTLVRAANACGEVFLTGSAKIVVLQPLANISELVEEVKVFPNPVIDVLQFSVSDAKLTNKPLEISLVNLLGREVTHFKKERTSSGEQISIPLNNLPIGVYILKLSNEDHTFSKRIIIQK